MAAGGDYETDSKRLGDTLVALESVNKLTVTDENGHTVEFGSLFKDTKAIVFFVRVSIDEILMWHYMHAILCSWCSESLARAKSRDA